MRWTLIMVVRNDTNYYMFLTQALSRFSLSHRDPAAQTELATSMSLIANFCPKTFELWRIDHRMTSGLDIETHCKSLFSALLSNKCNGVSYCAAILGLFGSSTQSLGNTITSLQRANDPHRRDRGKPAQVLILYHSDVAPFHCDHPSRREQPTAKSSYYLLHIIKISSMNICNCRRAASWHPASGTLVSQPKFCANNWSARATSVRRDRWRREVWLRIVAVCGGDRQ